MSTDNLSYDVRIWKIDTYAGKRGKTYTVRWAVAGKRSQQTFAHIKLADSFRSKLTTAAREGVPFDIATGLPQTMLRQLSRRTWYEHAAEFVDVKWPHASPRHRKNISEALAAVTIALLPSRTADEMQQIRSVLRNWSFNKAARGGSAVLDATPQDKDAVRLRWIADNSPDLSKLREAPVMRRALDALALKLDGKSAAPATVTRKRSAFYSAMEYAVELELFEANPIDKVQWTKPENTDIVDRRVVANPSQARSLLRAVREIYPALEAFFGCLYFAGLRPSEAKHLSVSGCKLPEDGWGELLLTGSTQHAGTDWTDSGEASEDRSLKHRPDKATRPVPACPELVELLRRHIDEFRPGPGGRLFVSRTGKAGIPLPPPYSNPVSSNTYARVWNKAREKALSEAQAASPLAKRPYDLRHAAVSLWLNAGVPATQVAEWAGHSVNVLLKVYAKCLDGQDEVARRRVEAALKEDLAERAA
ncbi:tyrosine-type recombinase/integrase [Kribbella sp. NPDC049174]|uniref:tyrosine-type recombinase/integrase n=1 Tax=Kribbella sp. NPDC049174 TaxID=3364112 RepID=UPI003717B19C